MWPPAPACVSSSTQLHVVHKVLLVRRVCTPRPTGRCPGRRHTTLVPSSSSLTNSAGSHSSSGQRQTSSGSAPCHVDFVGDEDDGNVRISQLLVPVAQVWRDLAGHVERRTGAWASCSAAAVEAAAPRSRVPSPPAARGVDIGPLSNRVSGSLQTACTARPSPPSRSAP